MVGWVSFHTFRHTCASLLFKVGRNLRQVAEWLGHADPGFTLRTCDHLMGEGTGRRRLLDEAVTVIRLASGPATVAYGADFYEVRLAAGSRPYAGQAEERGRLGTMRGTGVPKGALLVLGAFAAAALGAVGALLIASGDSGDPVTTTVTEAATEEEPSDAESGEDFSFSPDAGGEDCDELGINSEELQEGECVDNGQTFRVVNRDSLLRLPELNVQVMGIDVTESLSGSFGESASASGQFVVLQLDVRNKTNGPVEFDIDQVGLLLGDNEYSSDFDSTQVLDDNLIYETIQPQANLTGTVVFDVPGRIVNELDETGNVLIVQFSDIQSYEGMADPLGVIRTYH